MVHYIIMCRSLTYAQRAARALERMGIMAIVMRPPAELSAQGCAYCVRIREKNLTAALKVMKEAGLSHGKIYLMGHGGAGEEVLP